MKKRRTLASPWAHSGIGLHSGESVHMRLVPAPAGSGIVFVRTDLGGRRVPALIENAGPSFYATVLQKDGATVSTIEHLMAALYAMQIDDLEVELDAAEVPILDGSSKPFVEGILAAGYEEHKIDRQYIHVAKPLTVTHEEKQISVHPCSEYRVTYAIEFNHPAMGYQELTASLWREDEFVEKIARQDVHFRARGPGAAGAGSGPRRLPRKRGGGRNSRPSQSAPAVSGRVRPAQDARSDRGISLLGRPLRGHVVAYRAGHDLHGKLARAIEDAKDAWYLAPWTPSAADPA